MDPTDRTGEPFTRDELSTLFGLDVDDPANAAAIERVESERQRQETAARRRRFRPVGDE